MSTYLSPRMLRLTKLRDRVDEAVGDLVSQRNVIVVTSQLFANQVIGGARRSLDEGKHLWIDRVPTQEAAGREPEDFLEDYYRYEDAFTKPWVHKDLHLPDVLLVEQPAEAPVEEKKRWLRFIGDWGERAQRLAAQANGRELLVPSFLFVVSDPACLDALPPSDKKLSLRWWWSVADPLAMRLVSRDLRADEGIQRLWREHHVAALAPWEPALAQAIWPRVDEGEAAVRQVVEAFAAASGVDEHKARAAVEAARAAHGEVVASPSERLRPYWLEGLLEQTEEYGVQASLLAHVVAGDEGEVRRRFWRAQSAFVLPSVDGVRVELCRALTLRHGPEWIGWAGRPEHPDEEEEMKRSPLATQLGHLKRTRDLHYSRLSQPERDWIQSAHAARIELAHGRPITYGEYKELRKASDALERHLAQGLPGLSAARQRRRPAASPALPQQARVASL